MLKSRRYKLMRNSDVNVANRRASRARSGSTYRKDAYQTDNHSRGLIEMSRLY